MLVGTSTNQIFIGRYRVNSAASAATQNITSVTSLFWWKNGTGCANYAQYILKPSRCSGPYSDASGYGSLYFP